MTGRLLRLYVIAKQDWYEAIKLKESRIVCDSEVGELLTSYRAAACTEVSGLKPDGFLSGDVFVPLAALPAAIEAVRTAASVYSGNPQKASIARGPNPNHTRL